MENSKNMCLLKMGSLEESFNAMAYLHDIDLGGRYTYMNTKIFNV